MWSSVKIGGIMTNVNIDSGATVNVIDRKNENHSKIRKLSAHQLRSTSKNSYAYGSKKQLIVAGSFTPEVKARQRCVNAEFFVVEEALLGNKTATERFVFSIL